MIKQLIKEELFYQITAIISWVNVYTASVFILLDWYKLHLVSISMKSAIRNNNNAQYSYHVNRLSLNWKSNHHRTSKHVGGWLNALSSNVIGFIKPSRTTHTMPLILIGNMAIAIVLEMHVGSGARNDNRMLLFSLYFSAWSDFI